MIGSPLQIIHFGLFFYDNCDNDLALYAASNVFSKLVVSAPEFLHLKSRSKSNKI